MISIEKLIHQLSQCKDSQITLPVENDNPNSKFVQKTAVEIRKMEIEMMNVKDLGEDISRYTNCTMDSDFALGNEKKKSDNSNNFSNAVTIPAKSLIVYIENECSSLPEILSGIFNVLKLGSCVSSTKSSKISGNDWYIYGVKNPDSFYKSFMLLCKVDFIIKNKTEKKNDIVTFKREMALQYENFYKTLNYRKLRFSRNTMVHNLTDEDNYTDIDIFQYISDYTKTNLIILDIINMKYIDIKFTYNNLVDEYTNKYKDNYVTIIKYSNNTYLPLMNTNGTHGLPIEFLNIIKSDFEKMQFKGYKDDDLDRSISENVTNNNIQPLVISENLLNSYTADKTNMVIEDMVGMEDMGEMVEIEEEESTPNNGSILTKDQLKSLEFIAPKYDIEKRLMGTNPVDLNTLMSKIPVVVAKEVEPPKNSNRKLPTKKIEIVQPSLINEKIIDLEEILNIQPKTSGGNNDSSDSKTKDKNNKTDPDDTLKPIGKYTLLELQMLAKLHKIPTQKQGKGTKMINKTKDEIYGELVEKF